MKIPNRDRAMQRDGKGHGSSNDKFRSSVRKGKLML
jgi:hypothetical protein